MKTKKIYPDFDSKVHVKLADLAHELEMDYRSIFGKQAKKGIFAIKTMLNGKKVVCFDKESAQKIRECTAEWITKSHVELTQIEKQCKINRPRMLLVLQKLKIVPEKRRRHEDNPRSVLTVKAIMVKKIKQAVSSLF